jgi:type IV pilus assembly protein PilN
MRITVNLASRPFADIGPALKRLRIAMAVLAVISLGSWLGIHLLDSQAQKERARAHSLDGALAQVNAERQGYESQLQQPKNQQVIAQAEALNQLIDEKSFSWTLAMEDLETVLPGGVQVTSLEPVRGKTGIITLHLRVLGPRDKAVELVENLEHSRRFVLPRIVNETADTGSGGPNQKLEPVSDTNRVNFDLLADYNPATPAERKAAAKKAAAEEKRGNSEAMRPSPNQPDAGFRRGPGARRVPYTGGTR